MALQKLHHTLPYEKADNLIDLSARQKELVEAAVRARESAYAPYSKFKVGASVRLANGKIISASNQENAAYPSGLCAERVAIFYAISQNPGEKIISIAVCGGETIAGPCGACRQVIAEFVSGQENPELLLHALGSETLIIKGLDAILPFAFTPRNLKSDS